MLTQAHDDAALCQMSLQRPNLSDSAVEDRPIRCPLSSAPCAAAGARRAALRSLQAWRGSPQRPLRRRPPAAGRPGPAFSAPLRATPTSASERARRRVPAEAMFVDCTHWRHLAEHLAVSVLLQDNVHGNKVLPQPHCEPMKHARLR